MVIVLVCEWKCFTLSKESSRALFFFSSLCLEASRLLITRIENSFQDSWLKQFISDDFFVNNTFKHPLFMTTFKNFDRFHKFLILHLLKSFV